MAVLFEPGVKVLPVANERAAAAAGIEQLLSSTSVIVDARE
jgi:hypothetical protein